MRKYVLIQKGQTAITGESAAKQVAISSFADAAKRYGIGESTLRKFLHAEGYRFSRKTSWQVEHLPGMGEADGDDGVSTPSAGAAEPAGTGGGLGLVEEAGIQPGHQPVGVGAESPE